MRVRGRLRFGLAMLGPAFVAAVAYVDPGNFATNIAGARVRLPAQTVNRTPPPWQQKRIDGGACFLRDRVGQTVL